MRNIRIFCDCCGKETHPQHMTCMLQYVRWEVFKLKKSTPKQYTQEYCSECQEKVLKAVEEVHKQVQADRTETKDGDRKDI